MQWTLLFVQILLLPPHGCECVTFLLVLDHPGSHGQRAVNQLCVCACVRACVCYWNLQFTDLQPSVDSHCTGCHNYSQSNFFWLKIF